MIHTSDLALDLKSGASLSAHALTTQKWRQNDTVLRAKRLILSPLGLNDVAGLIGVFNHADTLKQTHGWKLPFDEAQALEFIASREVGAETHPGYGLRLEEGTLIGVIYLSGRTCGQMGGINAMGPNLSIFIAPEHQSKGFGREAIEAFILWLQSQGTYHVLQAAHFDDNAGSARLLHKADFLYTGRVSYETSGARSEPTRVRHMIRLI